MAAARFFLEFPGAKLSEREGFSDIDMRQKKFFVLNPAARRWLIEE
jgi:hypothetical protein